MAGAGHPWFAEARGRLLEHIGRDGIGQGELAKRADLTKQAVAQHLDQLEAEGLLRRVQDPSDSRKRRVVWTKKGEAALSDIDLAKRRVEGRLKRRLGAGQFAALKAGLKAVIE
ncbi:MarR family winged helix-turn-helix transcriptional regulator [Ovoidimarina sediminis]|uniref:MarR family winged helix-turn-helix transcriptional regulator n=1 Tax=Ovoidimarina sediminis TaxID=3079856 RepID=UPI002915A170|nr:MarR family transcriptional regulator [Rhodophyticola sp. MJ-SS7]MDU8944743.1 MarR family transcriptional regulator [Rhodophyticola sp. MJ-SS7]